MRQLLCAFERPRTMVETPRNFAEFAQRAHQESLSAAGVEKGSSLGEHCDEELCRLAEEACKIAPMVAALPVAFYPVLEVIGIEPITRDRHWRAQVGLALSAVEALPLRVVSPTEQLGQTSLRTLTDRLERIVPGENFSGGGCARARRVRLRAYCAHQLASVRSVGFGPLHRRAIIGIRLADGSKRMAHQAVRVGGEVIERS